MAQIVAVAVVVMMVSSMKEVFEADPSFHPPISLDDSIRAHHLK